MNRRFYTDPLAAAWMAKHFGMRFSHPEQPEGYGEPDLMRFWADSAPIAGHEIHPDSLHLLEPQVSDVIRIDNVVVGLDEQGDLVAGNLIQEVRASAHFPEMYRYTISKGGLIIQRDGKAFHWPETESEAA